MQSKSLIFLGVSLVLAACSSGGRSLVPNQQCAADYNPVPMGGVEGDKEKITWDKTADALPPGNYVETGAILYYVDDERAAIGQNFRVKVQETSNKDGSLQVDSTVNCVRNARAGLKLDLAVEGVTHMTVDNNKVVTETDTRQFKFTMNDQLNGKFEAPQKKAGTDPKTIYQGKTTDSYIARKSDNDYEIRSQGRYDNGTTHGTYYLLTSLRRVDAPACADAGPFAAAPAGATALNLVKANELTAGTYVTESTSVYLVDLTQSYRLQVTDKATGDSRVTCESGAGDKLTPKGLTIVDTLTQITVDADRQPVFEKQAYRLSFQRLKEPARTSVEFKPVNAAAAINTRELQVSALQGSPVIYRLDAHDEKIEVRSRATTTIGGQVVNLEIATTLRRKL